MLQKLFFRERKPLPAFHFGRGRRCHVVVDAWDLDMTLGILRLGEKLNQSVDGVGRGTAVHAGVEIARRSLRFHFHVHQAAQADAESGYAVSEQFGIGDQRHVGFQFLRMFGNVLGDRLAADFLLALNQELHIERKCAMHGLQGFDGLDVHVHLTLVIAGATGIDVAVADGWLKGRRVPKLQRVRRLNVVVPVAENSRFPGRMEPIGVDQRVTLGRNHLDVFQASGAQTAGDEFSRAVDIRFVIGQGTDARNAQQVEKLVEQSTFVRAHKFLDGGRQAGRRLLNPDYKGFAKACLLR